MINGEYKIEKYWKETIRNAAVYIGKSWSTKNINDAFLFNVIALETLLTENHDKYRAELSSRIKSFIGWVGYWSTENYENRINEIYTKRCKLVHEGRFDLINADDVLFTDDLLFNNIDNIINHIILFNSKEKIIEFSKKIEAEHLLGIKGKTRPKTIRFMHKNYNDKDKQEISQT